MCRSPNRRTSRKPCVATRVKRLLIVTAFFPPCTLAPSRRVAGWARNLARFGWEPTVVCRYWGVGDDPYALPPERRVRHERADGYSVYWVPYLANARDRWIQRHGLNRGVAGRRALSLALAILERISPAFDALRATRDFALEYVQRERVDAILVTGNPFTLFRVGYEARRRYGVPWVADYRDAWSTTQLHAQGLLVPSLRAWDAALERRWVGTAAFFTTASPHFVRGIEQVVNRPGHALLTGYSEDEFSHEEDTLFPEFTLCYLGTLHAPQRVERLVAVVIRLLLELGPEAKLSVRMLGVRYNPSQAERVQRVVAGFERHFEITDRMPRAEALRTLARSHLLVQMGYEGCEGVMPGKIYEYMAARRPVLLFPSDDGILADMIRGTGIGFVAESEASALTHLRKLYHKWVNTGAIARPDPVRLAPYSQETQVRRLASLLDEHLPRHGAIHIDGHRSLIQDADGKPKLPLKEARTSPASTPTQSTSPKSLRSIALDILCAVLHYSGLLSLGLRVRRLLGGGRTRVLCYHRVADDEWPDTLKRKRFVEHLVHLRRHYHLIDVDTVVECLGTGRPLPRDTVAITFDDGYQSLVDILGELRSHGAPAAFFVLTGDLPESGAALFDLIRGTPLEGSRLDLASLPLDARRARMATTPLTASAPRLMSASDLRAVMEGGFEVGSHTRSHPLLTALPVEEFGAEIAGSRDDLCLTLGVPPRFFAYPWGKHHPVSRDAVRSAGYTAAFTTEDRAVDDESDLLAIPRVHVPGNASVARLAGEASGLIEFLRRVA